LGDPIPPPVKTTAGKIHIPGDFIAVDMQMEDHIAVLRIHQGPFTVEFGADAIDDGILETDCGKVGVLHVRTVLHCLGDREGDVGIDPVLPGYLGGRFVQFVCIEDVFILEQAEQYSGCCTRPETESVGRSKVG